MVLFSSYREQLAIISIIKLTLESYLVGMLAHAYPKISILLVVYDS